MVCYDRTIFENLQINLNIEKIIFKVVQMTFLAMHITNQILSFDIFTEGNVLNIFMEHDLNIPMIFGIKVKIDNFDSYNVLLAIAPNIPVLLMCSRVTYYKRLTCMHLLSKARWVLLRTSKVGLMFDSFTLRLTLSK